MKYMGRWRSCCRLLATATMVLVFLVPSPGSGAPRENSFVVLVDPAHGGDDPGVVSGKLREKDLTLKIALLVREEAQKLPGLHVQLTRSTDRTLSITQRGKSIEATKAAVLLSLHFNAGFGKDADGYEFYFPGFRQSVSEAGGNSSAIIRDMERNTSLNDSVRLAHQMQSALETVFPRQGRGLREAPIPLLDGLSIPALAVEVGFLTNTADRKKLTDEETQKAIARALATGLSDYLRKSP